ncbi:hypothetical protein H9Q71_007071 [Fusarium xylarioides]|nr:hypothetical protein H9Q71_007071 [Fusarium xylarioides]
MSDALGKEPRRELQLSKRRRVRNTKRQVEVKLSNTTTGEEGGEFASNVVTCAALALEDDGLDGEAALQNM